MKKILFGLVAAILLILLTSCGRTEGAEEEQGTVKTTLSVIPQEETGSVTETTGDGTPAEAKTGGKTETETETTAEELVAVALAEWNPKGDNDYYLMPDSDQRLLTEEDLEGFSNTELRIIRNEIAARHGWEFSDPELSSYFITQKWYEPKEGENDRIQFSAVETVNMDLLAELENGEEQPADYRRLGQLTELELGEDYEFRYGEAVIRLYAEEVGDLKYLTLSDNVSDTKIKYLYGGLSEDERILIYNRENDSFLLTTGMCGENDTLLIEVYLLDQSGISRKQVMSGSVEAYTRNGFCNHYEALAIGKHTGYEWLFIEGDKWIPKGKTVTEEQKYVLRRELACFVVEEGGISEVFISPGETLKLVGEDFRQKNVRWLELKRGNQLVLFPMSKRSSKDLNGVGLWEYFEGFDHSPAG